MKLKYADIKIGMAFRPSGKGRKPDQRIYRVAGYARNNDQFDNPLQNKPKSPPCKIILSAPSSFTQKEWNDGYTGFVNLPFTLEQINRLLVSIEWGALGHYWIDGLKALMDDHKTPYHLYHACYKSTGGVTIGFEFRENGENTFYYNNDLPDTGHLVIDDRGHWWETAPHDRRKIISISVSSIVEGSDVEVDPIIIKMPFNPSSGLDRDSFWNAVETVDNHATFYWMRDNSVWMAIYEESRKIGDGWKHAASLRWEAFDDAPIWEKEHLPPSSSWCPTCRQLNPLVDFSLPFTAEERAYIERMLAGYLEDVYHNSDHPNLLAFRMRRRFYTVNAVENDMIIHDFSRR